MLRARVKFCFYCVLLWLATILVLPRVQIYVSRSVWWLATQSGATTASAFAFSERYSLLLDFLIGFAMGLIPFQSLREWVVSSFGLLRYKLQPSDVHELHRSRPVLWAWLLPTFLFVVRFVTFGMEVDHSVLGGDVVLGPSRMKHFFGTFDMANLSPDSYKWLLDRSLLTGPVLFLLAYPAAVWLRHHLPHHALVAEGASEAPTDTLGS